MLFFKHPCDAYEQPFFQRIEHQWGWAGLGYFWRVMELLTHGKRKIPVNAVLLLKTSGLSLKKKIEILSLPNNEFFYLNRKNEICLGVKEKTDDEDEQMKIEFPHAGDHTGDQAGDHPCACAVPCSSTKEEDKEKKKNKKEILTCQQLLEQAATVEERDFYANMMEHYPRVCQMKLPLTYEELKRLLRDRHTYEELNWTLIQMENYLPLLKKCVSANLTLRNWIRRQRINFGGYNNNINNYAQNY